MAVIRSLPTALLAMNPATSTARGHARKEVLHLFVTVLAATRGCDLARTVWGATAVMIAGGTWAAFGIVNGSGWLARLWLVDSNGTWSIKHDALRVPCRRNRELIPERAT